MLSLTVNTSSSLGSMVLGSGTQTLNHIEWHKEKSHSEKITTALESLFSKTPHQMQDLQLLICGYGPGSFTGLRVGLSVIKTLGYVMNLPIIAVDDCFTLALNALSLAPQEPIVVMVDAQKNKVFAGIYEIHGGKLKTVLPPTLLSFIELDAELKKQSYLCIGDAYANYETFFPESLKKKLKRPTSALDEPHAKIVFDYVMKHENDFAKINWDALSALYLRASAAEEVLAEKLSKNK